MPTSPESEELEIPAISCAYCGNPLGTSSGEVYKNSGRHYIGWHAQYENLRSGNFCYFEDPARSLAWGPLVEEVGLRGENRIGIPHWKR